MVDIWAALGRDGVSDRGKYHLKNAFALGGSVYRSLDRAVSRARRSAEPCFGGLFNFILRGPTFKNDPRTRIHVLRIGLARIDQAMRALRDRFSKNVLGQTSNMVRLTELCARFAIGLQKRARSNSSHRPSYARASRSGCKKRARPNAEYGSFDRAMRVLRDRDAKNELGQTSCFLSWFVTCIR